MSDPAAVDALPVPTATRWIRRGTMTVGLLVGAILLPLFGWLLIVFSPEVTGSHEPPPPGFHAEPPGGAVAWVALLVASVAAVTCLALGWIRLNRPGWWWFWPLGLAGCLAAGFVAAETLV
ncbi:hypothetical protein DLE60_02900 [Micromonospora globispora]|uniref:Uncharacterized protein n=1 Tax=Micromonospora globispora TaxID=1450148 RepID=A0A317JWA7_9ACTN|nr:hypothetical protein [Micromonospora globispora]PWU43363.1 hypothetical protein DLJ46_31780 [Micromonospora globispora]PWU61965.1 hypothetical protein DLE60_02900 [Micromonospora globispora]RQX04922.1 hypothetical protein DKL51_03075 [Micromonospora globispora]